MKYQGTVAQIKTIQDAMLKTNLCWVFDKKGWWPGPIGSHDPGTPKIDVKLSVVDKAVKHMNGWHYYVSFHYETRNDQAEMWVLDSETGRFIKMFDNLFHLFGELTPVKLPDKEAEGVKQQYQMNKVLKQEA